MFADNWVTRDVLYATGATFTVVAWGFAYLYLAVQIAYPHSFTIYGVSGESRHAHVVRAALPLHHDDDLDGSVGHLRRRAARAGPFVLLQRSRACSTSRSSSPASSA